MRDRFFAGCCLVLANEFATGTGVYCAKHVLTSKHDGISSITSCSSLFF